MLFIVAPTADNLLLNVIALQFLIDIDNICYASVMDDATKERLVKKMMLCYLQNGEKTYDDAHEAKKCASCKWIISHALAVVGYLAFGLWVICPYLFAFATWICM